MNIPLVDLKKEFEEIKDEVLPEIRRVVAQGVFIKGEDLEGFEKNFASYCRVKRCVGVKSGTAALFLAQKALDVNGEVVTVPNTFIATAESITMAGNRIRFVDVDEETGLMDLEKLKEAVSQKTKAVMPVHLYGQMVDMKAVKETVGSRDIKIIEDACQAHGATYDGKPPGYYSDCACYSFYPGKNLGAYGDGGAVATNNTELAELVYKLRDHGRGPKDKYEHSMEGYNERLDNLQAAVLNVKLRHLDSWVAKRREIAAEYDKLLTDMAGITTPHVDPKAEHAYHLYVINVKKQRDRLLRHLQSNGIGAGIHYPVPLHLQRAYSYLGHKKGDFKAAEKSSAEIISLPMHPFLMTSNIQTIVNEIGSYCSG